ncbi:MAG: acyl-CoA dehydrogenase family protein [Dehalococcoidia bacterium]|nr:acyl-CoA dehydrogenase family protein [Dehalococcoidia bacterium]
MDFTFTLEEEAFRTRLKEWLAVNMKELPRWWAHPDVPGPEIDSEEFHRFSIWWHRKLHQAGFAGITWPIAYGGRGGTLMEEVIFHQEMALHRAPGLTNVHGIGWCGPAILRFGTEVQKKRFIPKILSCEEMWCTFYSEPEAGSDMANVQTRALEEGDHFVVNGQKVWSSHAHLADWAVLLARTDPTAPKHRGLSYLLVDMKTPGITVRPLRNMTGTAEFNETFFDNVRIPRHQIIGEKNMGWYVAAGALEFERSSLGQAIARENTFKDLIRVIQQQGKSNDPLIRYRMAQLFIEVNVAKYLGLRNLTKQLRDGRPGPEGSIGSLFNVELNKRIQEFVMEVQGPYSRLMRGSPHAIEQGRWQYSFLRSRGASIETGTTEIKRNIIAQRVLGLPR